MSEDRASAEASAGAAEDFTPGAAQAVARTHPAPKSRALDALGRRPATIEEKSMASSWPLAILQAMGSTSGPVKAPMRTLSLLRSWAPAACILSLASSCKEPPPSPSESTQETAQNKAQSRASTLPPATSSRATANEHSPKAFKEKSPPAKNSPGDFVLDRRQKLGPSAPVTAAQEGAVFISRTHQLIIASRQGDKLFKSIDGSKKDFTAFARGPSLSPTHAYWVSESGKLLAANRATGQVRTLHLNARKGTRTSALTHNKREYVAFIAESEDTGLAFVWSGVGESQGELAQVSPEGSGATSVAIVLGKSSPLTIVLAGRSGMSPIHTRKVHFTNGSLRLDQDTVVWIAPGSHPLTELVASTKSSGGTWVFLSTAKDFSDFGLARLDLKTPEREAAEPAWMIFPNGLDPAPTQATRLCDKDYVLYARPRDSSPDSPQELYLTPNNRKSFHRGTLVARSRGFVDASIAATDHGALLVWTTASATWGRILTCRHQGSTETRN